MGNCCQFDGRLGQDAELKYSQSNVAYCRFSIANNTGFGDKRKTEWVSCVLFGKRAESLHQYLVKGTRVVAIGEISMNEWEGKDGNMRRDLSLACNDVWLMTSKKDAEGGGAEAGPARRSSAPAQQAARPTRAAAPQQTGIDDDDIPF